MGVGEPVSFPHNWRTSVQGLSWEGPDMVAPGPAPLPGRQGLEAGEGCPEEEAQVTVTAGLEGGDQTHVLT